jgi:hypothetical protein
MKKRAILTATVVCVLLVVLAIGAAACGGGATTTTAAPTTTTAAPTTTTAAATVTTGAATDTTAGATATTAAGATTVPSIQMTAELTAYLGQMQTLFAGLSSIPDSEDPLKISDVSKVTDAQIATAEKAMEQIKTALAGLKDIKAPAELAAFHETLSNAITGELAVAAKAIQALKDKNQAAFDAAKAEGDKLEAQLNTALEQLVPLMMGGTPTS